MSCVNFIETNLKETVQAIKYLAKNKGVITVKSIRGVNKIKSSNRSKINFIWRALDRLAWDNHLKLINDSSPKIYKLTSSGKEYINNFNLKK